MVITPDLPTLSYQLVNGMKYFELVARSVQREILPGLFIKALGYNQSTPGPTIQVYPGDHVNIRVFNRLDEPTSVHWHGLDIPNVMDGAPGMTASPEIKPGSYFDYQFQITNPPGTHMYHTHLNPLGQEMAGMEGGFIILDPTESHIQRDFFIMLQEFKVKKLPPGYIAPGVYDIDPHAMDFNFFTMNGRCFPYTTPLEICKDENVRIRLANAMEHAHPIHLHGHQFFVTAVDGNRLPEGSCPLRSNILVASGDTWDIEFNANNPGSWPFHCHIPHHMTNNMSKEAGGMMTTLIYRN